MLVQKVEKMAEQKKLSDEDMARVAEYLGSPVHKVDRQSFRPWLLLGGWFIVVSIFSLISLWYAWYKGVLPLPSFL
jgi:hypothetical protein